MSVLHSQRLLLQFNSLSTSGRLEDVKRVMGTRPVPGPAAPGLPRPFRDSPATALTSSRSVTCEATARPPAGPSTILCSSLGKERKKLAKVLKSHRKMLEKRLSALTRAEVDAPVLSELLTEIRALTSRLDSQRAASLLHHMDDSDSSSDSDNDDECDTRSAAALCARRASTSLPTQQLEAQPMAAAPSTPASDSIAAASDPATAGTAISTRMVVSTLSGEVELSVPAPVEGWNWDEDEFRSAQFDGTGGRVMVCTGSKCQRKGATEVLRAVSALAEGNPNIDVVPCKCVGKCSAGAALRVRPQGQPCATYTQVRPTQLRDVFLEHFAATAAAPSPPLLSPSHSPVAAPAVTAPVCALLGSSAAAATHAQSSSQPHLQVTCCAECQGL